MSLRKLMKKRAPIPSAREETTATDIPEPEPAAPELAAAGTPAVIPQDKQEGLAELVRNLQTNRGFSMNEILSMDSQQKGVYDALVIPIGGLESDKYKMLERTRLTQYEIELFTDAIDQAEHGLGYHMGTASKADDLDFPIPRLGEWVVSKLRGYVSKDGASLAIFENVAQPWIQRLYDKQKDLEAQAQRGIQQ